MTILSFHDQLRRKAQRTANLDNGACCLFMVNRYTGQCAIRGFNPRMNPALVLEVFYPQPAHIGHYRIDGDTHT